MCVCATWGHFQGLSPVVAPVDGVDHVFVHQAWLLVTLPPPLLLAGARRGEMKGGGLGILRREGGSEVNVDLRLCASSDGKIPR